MDIFVACVIRFFSRLLFISNGFLIGSLVGLIGRLSIVNSVLAFISSGFLIGGLIGLLDRLSIVSSVLAFISS
ncbi:MAG: hypothetical protein H0Z33_10640, partial [Bacillaceae bacterium]|nr:hypothetical protein [Bacillaceae bacterium]